MSTRFTIVIIHRNGFSRLKSALDSILKASSDSDEIFIVDNASNDNSIQQILKIYKNINVIYNTCNAGYGFAANQAIKEGKGNYFLICNNDITVPVDILDKFESAFSRDKKVGMISGQQTNLKGENIRTSSKKPSIFSEFDGIGRIDHSKDPIEISEVGIVRGACLGVRKSTIDAIGAYDDDFFFYFEDTEWCIRMARNGWKIVLNPFVKIPHIGGSSSNEFYSGSRIEFYRSRIIYWKKIYPKLLVLLLYAWNIPKLILDLSFYTIANILTFGQNHRLRKKMIDRAVVLSWILLGQPKSWGLPDKC